MQQNSVAHVIIPQRAQRGLVRRQVKEQVFMLAAGPQVERE